jgi:hypothetical protein
VHKNKTEWPCHLTLTIYNDTDTASEMLETNPTLTWPIAQKDFGHNNNCIRKKKLLLLCLIHIDNNNWPCENDI